MKGDHTPNRGIRIPDPLWAAAKAKADAEHVTLTSVIIRALERYVNKPIPLTVTATRDGRWWSVEVEGIGFTQARNLSEVETMARDLVAVTLDVDPSRVVLRLVVAR